MPQETRNLRRLPVSRYPAARTQMMGATWLEPEEAAYPHGGMTRRAYVRLRNGSLHLVYCGIPDTYFSIPAVVRVNARRVRGFISVRNDEFTFTADAVNPTPVL